METDGRDHASQHDAIRGLPLITDSATVATGLGAQLERWLGRMPDSGVDARLDPGAMDVSACGINAMVYSLVKAVERLGVPPARIRSEGFG